VEAEGTVSPWLSHATPTTCRRAIQPFPHASPCGLIVPLLQYATLRGAYALLDLSLPRFPVCCPVTYQCGLFDGHGTVWNLSCTGWRPSGDLPMRPVGLLKMYRLLFKLNWVIGATLLTGCISSPVVTPLPLPSGPKITVPGNAIICVPVPPDAVFEGEPYPGSGDEIARQIMEGLEEVGRTTQLVKESYSNAKVLCKEKGVRLALEARIEHYEDRVTGWSGRPDRIELRRFLFEIDHPDQKRSM
jgi:hypothetical protein